MLSITSGNPISDILTSGPAEKAPGVGAISGFRDDKLAELDHAVLAVFVMLRLLFPFADGFWSTPIYSCGASRTGTGRHTAQVKKAGLPGCVYISCTTGRRLSYSHIPVLLID
jgi:hypothetical protein